MRVSSLMVSSIYAPSVLAFPTGTFRYSCALDIAENRIAAADEILEKRNPALEATKGWGPNWGAVAVGGAAVATGVNNIWQGIKNGAGGSADSDEGQKLQDAYAKSIPNSAGGYASPFPQAQSNGVPFSAGNYAPPYPQGNNGPQWQNAPQPVVQPDWQNIQPAPPARQKNPNPPIDPEHDDDKEPEPKFEDIDSKKPPGEKPAMKPVGMSVTLAAPVVCRKFPDTVISSSWSQNVYAGGSKLFVNCWTTASMPDDLGKVEKSPVWLKTDRGCYISDSSTDDWVDFQSKLPFCVSPTHWAATARPEYEANLECYQCPTLKCPKTVMSKSTTVDVQCIVDGEEARGNSTWVKPIDQTCYLPGEIFTKGGWLGKFDLSTLSPAC